jgi:hypothetical protein
MSGRKGGKKKPRKGKGKAKPKAQGRSRPYWTLLLWLLAIGALLVIQTRRLAGQRHAEVEKELQRLEQQYEDRVNELQLQVELLQSQLDSGSETSAKAKTAR